MHFSISFYRLFLLSGAKSAQIARFLTAHHLKNQHFLLKKIFVWFHFISIDLLHLFPMDFTENLIHIWIEDLGSGTWYGAWRHPVRKFSLGICGVMQRYIRLRYNFHEPWAYLAEKLTSLQKYCALRQEHSYFAVKKSANMMFLCKSGFLRFRVSSQTKFYAQQHKKMPVHHYCDPR